MAVRVVAVQTIPELLSEVEKLKPTGLWLFRGVADIERHTLLPSIGRALRGGRPVLPPREVAAFQRFQRVNRLRPELAGLSQLEWLALAQHEGVPTRLLDWTLNPLVAAHFVLGEYGLARTVGAGYIRAVIKKFLPSTDADAAVPDGATFTSLTPITGGIYAVRAPRDASPAAEERPFNTRSVTLVQPSDVSERVRRQLSLFTLHPNPAKAWRPKECVVFTVDMHAKQEWREALPILGISRETLFPSHDAYASRIAWNLKWNHRLL